MPSILHTYLMTFFARIIYYALFISQLIQKVYMYDGYSHMIKNYVHAGRILSGHYILFYHTVPPLV